MRHEIVMGALVALVSLLLAAAPAFPFDPETDFDPALWTPVQLWAPTQNTSGIDGLDGTNTPGNGKLGKGDICYWSWNLPNPPCPEIAPMQVDLGWRSIDVTRTWWGVRSGIPKNVKAVWIHVQVIMTPGAYPNSYPTMEYQFRGAGTLNIDPAKTPSHVVGARLQNTILVPVKDGKIEFRWKMAPWPQPPHPAGATFGHHIVVLQPER